MWTRSKNQGGGSPLSNFRDCNRTFNSPKHSIRTEGDYNTYMMIQKSLQLKQSPKKGQECRVKKESAKQSKIKHPNSIYQSVMLPQLAKQNDFLIDEVMKYKEQAEGYKKTIAKLKRCKSQKCTAVGSENNVTIIDQQNFSRLNFNVIESKLTTDKYPTATTAALHQNQKQSRCKKLLQQSLIYIKHSRMSLSHEIEEQNDKLCRLIQLSALEKDQERKKQNRLKISNCVKQLKELRRHYQQMYC